MWHILMFHIQEFKDDKKEKGTKTDSLLTSKSKIMNQQDFIPTVLQNAYTTSFKHKDQR